MKAALSLRSRTAHYIAQAAAGLEHADRCGLIHRDIKPGNILLDRTGVVKILDLGLARFARDLSRNRSITARFDTNSVLGTVDYMAPEQASGQSEVDIRADIYSLGCTMYFLLDGIGSFSGRYDPDEDVLASDRAPEPLSVLCPRIPQGLSQVLDRMMAKEPNDRFQKADEIVQALSKWTSEPISPPADNEMPVQAVSIYRLGLSPPPVVTSLPVSAPQFWASETVPQARRGALQTPTATNPVRPVKIDSINDPSIVLTPTKLASSKKGLSGRQMAWLLLAGLVVISVGGFFLWRALQEKPAGRIEPAQKPESTDPNPTRKENDPKPVTFAGVVLSGGGSTFVSPIMQRWTEVYEKDKGVRVNYSGKGSGAGIKGVVAGEYLFGCTDAAMTDDELAQAEQKRGQVLHIPLVMGAVVPTYYIPGVKDRLKFTGRVLAGIYLGAITHWDDDTIRINNPGINLPHLKITVVHRKESSGTTFIWTDYLGKASAEWSKKVGKGKEVKWPCGVEETGNAGIATRISTTEGSIGYLELTYALENNLTIGEVKNREGRPILASLESVTAAGSASLQDIPDDSATN